MTLGQLRSRLAQYLGLDATSSDGLIAFWDTDLLNRAADDIANLYRLPRKTITIGKSDLEAGPVDLPSDFLEVVHVIAPPTTPIAVLDPDSYLPDPDERLPLETLGDGMAVLIRDGTPKKLELVKRRWVEPPEGGLLVHYWSSYAPMVNDTDKPWGGALERFHPVIAAKAAMNALLSMDFSEQETAARFQMAKADYDKYMEYLLENLDGPIYLSGGNILSMVYNRGRTR